MCAFLSQIFAHCLMLPWRETAVRSAASLVTQMPVGCPVSLRLSARPATPLNCPRLCLIKRGGAWDAWPMGAWGWEERRTGHASHLPVVPTPVVTTPRVTTPHWRRCRWAWHQSSQLPAPPPVTPRKEKYTCEITTPTIFDWRTSEFRHGCEKRTSNFATGYQLDSGKTRYSHNVWVDWFYLFIIHSFIHLFIITFNMFYCSFQLFIPSETTDAYFYVTDF